MCNHTWIPICGFDESSTKIRSFPDECDMIEYNCDYKTGLLQNSLFEYNSNQQLICLLIIFSLYQN